MHIAFPILLLVAIVVLVASWSRHRGLSAPLVLTAVGALASYLPWMPRPFAVDPEIVLLGFLPPLLFAAASQTSLIDLGRNRVQILSLSVFLVLFTAFGVAVVAWVLMDGWLNLAIPFAAAFALGGVVAPPDAVAATAVARRIGLPKRVVTILEGESLFNDATALVTVRTAAAAAVVGGASFLLASRDFIIAAVGGVVVGLIAFKVIAYVRTHVTETVTDVAISFLSPWLAYLPAEQISIGGASPSGVIAVVVCGVLLAHQAPVIQTAQSRVSERLNWSTIQFLLENMVFLLIGLQTNTIVHAVEVDPDIGLGAALVVGFAVLATVMVLRPLFVLPLALLWKRRGAEGAVSLRESAVISWAGMRGVVTLAAAFLLPEDFPQREAVVLIALIVTIGTLIIHGFSLGALSRRLDLHGPDPREDALQTAQVTQAAIRAGSAELDRVLTDPEVPAVPDEVVQALRTQADRRANASWERLGRRRDDSEPPSQRYRELRTAMLQAERAKVLTLRDSGRIDHDVLRSVMASLDLEESMIAMIDTREENLNDRMLLLPESRQGGCADLLAVAETQVEPKAHDECPECVRDGTTWVHLRECLTCGNVGCCDSSVSRHATRHFEETGHPVMRSFEPGEAWRWCFRHHLLG